MRLEIKVNSAYRPCFLSAGCRISQLIQASWLLSWPSEYVNLPKIQTGGWIIWRDMTTQRAESMIARGAEAPKEAKNLQVGAQLGCHQHPDESQLLKTKMTGTQPSQKNKPSCRSGHVFNQTESGNARAAWKRERPTDLSEHSRPAFRVSRHSPTPPSKLKENQQSPRAGIKPEKAQAKRIFIVFTTLISGSSACPR